MLEGKFSLFLLQKHIDVEAPAETAAPNSPASQHSKYSNSVISANCTTLAFSPPKKSKSYV